MDGPKAANLPCQVWLLVCVEALRVGDASVREECADGEECARAAPVAATDLVRVDLEDADDAVHILGGEPVRRQSALVQ